MQSTTTLQLGFGPTLSFIDPKIVASAFFFLIVFLVFIYTLIAVYHWVRYGHDSIFAIPAIVAHIFVSIALVLFAATGLP